MGVLDLQTDLKSLKYGQDRPNGGSSGQPYIQTDIRTVDATFSRANLTLYDDGLVRGGMVASQNASFIDTKRIAKFLIDPPKGPLFLIKQVGLQLSNPQLEQRGTTTERYVGSSRIYNLGINTLAQIPLTALGEHIVRHGILPVDNPDSYYESVVTANNLQNDGRENRLLKLLNRVIGDSSEVVINKYVGGPGSTYGIGSTLIRRAVTPVDSNNILLEITNNNAGQALVNGQRQAFSYVDPDTDNGIITRALGQSNARSEKNRTRYIGGVEYGNKGLNSIFTDINSDLNAVVQATDQSVYGNNPTSQSLQNSKDFAGNSRITKDKIKLFQTADFGISNLTGSIFNGGKSFNLLSDTEKINENTSPFFFVGSNNDKRQFWAGKSAETADEIKVRENLDFEISTKTGSVFAPQDFDLKTSIDIYTNPSLYNFRASNRDTGSHDRKSGLPDLENSNDITKNGPSSYPSVGDINELTPLDVQQNAFNFTNPNIKTYTTIADSVRKQTAKGVPLLHTDIGNYTYNTGTKLVFNRTNDTNVSNDTLALKFQPILPFSGTTADAISFLGYITDYTDTFDSTWNDIKYVGRAEKFYIFNEFKRSISLGFNIPCFNEKELKSKHQNLNKLASILAGQYNAEGLLGGVITNLTLGNYIANQPGIITNLSFNPIEGSSWDLDDKLAFYIKVSLSFTLIHSGLQQYGYNFINA
jgi:hypothetical protein